MEGRPLPFFLFRTDEWTQDKVKDLPLQRFASLRKKMSFDLTYAMNGQTLMVVYFTGILPQPQATWQFLTLLRWPMPGSADSPSSSSGGREASTGWFTRSSWCFVGPICFSVCYTGDSSCCSAVFLLFCCACPLSVTSPYRFMLTPKQQEVFERVALYCDQFTNTNFIPVLFVLGESPCSSSISGNNGEKKKCCQSCVFFSCCRFLCNYGLQPLVGSVH